MVSVQRHSLHPHVSSCHVTRVCIKNSKFQPLPVIRFTRNLFGANAISIPSGASVLAAASPPLLLDYATRHLLSRGDVTRVESRQILQGLLRQWDLLIANTFDVTSNLSNYFYTIFPTAVKLLLKIDNAQYFPWNFTIHFDVKHAACISSRSNSAFVFLTMRASETWWDIEVSSFKNVRPHHVESCDFDKDRATECQIQNW